MPLPTANDFEVAIAIVDRDGRQSGPHGLVTEHTVTLPWFCNANELACAKVRLDHSPSSGRWGPTEFFEDGAANPGEPRYLHVRIPTCQNAITCFDAHRIHGARFGTRHFERVATVHERRTFHQPPGDSGIRTIDETWAYTFTRCPEPRPC